jgi:PP-loop superfamily ATP-utilizing enzyme
MRGASDPVEARIAAAAAVLAELGYRGCSVDVAGHEHEIAVISAGAAQHAVLLDARRADIVARIKALGFRYVAVDLLAHN